MMASGHAAALPYIYLNLQELMARSEGFEPPTPRFEVWCSIRLSYERLAGHAQFRMTPASPSMPAIALIGLVPVEINAPSPALPISAWRSQLR